MAESYAVGPAQPAVRDLTLGDLLSEAAAAVPDRIALIAGVPDLEQRRQWTYRQLHDEAVRAARALALRFEPGERVAIWAPNIPEWVIVEFAAAMAGVVLVTVNPALRPSEVAYVLNQSQSSGILLVPEFRGNAMLGTITDIAPECPSLREVIRFDQWDEFVASGEDDAIQLPSVDPADAVMIQYTSGTTGFPKGALLHHRGLVNNATHTADRLGVQDGWVWISTMPLFHTGGCVLCVLGSVAKRVTNVLVEAFEPGLVLELFETYGGNVMVGVPTMLVAMLEHPDFEQRDLSSVKALTSGGSTVPAPLVRRFEEGLGAPFTIVFGQTECSPVATMTYPHDTIEDKADTIGLPMPNVEVKIIDPESGEIVPAGTVGEFCTRGYHVMHGYFDMPEATAETIDADGWLHTGDLCSMDERGYGKVEGRLKDMIIRGGENIYPRELEDLLFKHPSVGEVAIVGLPDETWGEVVAAFLRPAPGHSVTRAELFTFVRQHLAPQKTPKLWFEVDQFPLTGSGKIQKFRLRELWERGDATELS